MGQALARTFAGAFALALLVVPRPAAAQLELEWDAPPACPGVEAVEAEVARLLGGSIPEEVTLGVRGVVRGEAGRFTLRLSTIMDGAAGERVVEGDACAPLGDAAALIIALMIDPAAVAEYAEPAEDGNDEGTTAAPTTAAPTTAAPTTDAEIAVARTTEPRAVEALGDPSSRDPSSGEPERERRSEGVVTRVVEHTAQARGTAPRAAPASSPEPVHGFLGVGGALDVGSVPDVSGAISVEGGVGVPLVEARLRASFVFGRDATREPGVGAQVSTATFDARACLHPFEEARFVYGCLGVAVGVSVADGFGLSTSEVGVGTFGAGVGGLGLAWAPEPWFDLDLDISVFVPFNPLEFAVRGSPDDVFHTQEPVAARVGLSAHARF